MYRGSCLCQGIKVEISGTISSVIYCHCSRCRKTSGSAFATNGYVNKSDFTIVSGEELLGCYETSNGKQRYFCSVCASPIYSANLKDDTRYRLRLGILDDEIFEKPECHNFVSSKACWHAIESNLPQNKTYEPGRDLSKQ